MIETICPKCSNAKTFSDENAGRKFKCPSCGEIILVEGKPSALPGQIALPAIAYVKNIVSDEDRMQDIIEEQISNNEQKCQKLLRKSRAWNGWGIAFYVMAGFSLMVVISGEVVQVISVGFWGGLGYWFQKKGKAFKEQAKILETENDLQKKKHLSKVEGLISAQPGMGEIEEASPL